MSNLNKSERIEAYKNVLHVVMGEQSGASQKGNEFYYFNVEIDLGSGLPYQELGRFTMTEGRRGYWLHCPKFEQYKREGREMFVNYDMQEAITQLAIEAFHADGWYVFEKGKRPEFVVETKKTAKKVESTETEQVSQEELAI